MTKGTIYIAGPMRGLPRYNFPAFDGAYERWRAAGWDVINPAQVNRALGFDETRGYTADGMATWMRSLVPADATAINRSDAIALLPGWEKSAGVAWELPLARFLHLEVYDAVTMERLEGG